MNVLVTGGTGNLGRHVVTLLRQSGHRARILSRHPRGHVDAVQGNLRTGAGLDRALEGMEVIIHAASATRHPVLGRSTDVGGTRKLLEIARKVSIRHVVFVSIVGIENVDYAYYKTKLRAENAVREGDVPWSILRATQFHEFVDHLVHRFSRVPGVAAVPFQWLVQPVDSMEVARRLVGVALAQPAGRLPDFGGPEVHDFKSLATALLAARHERRRLVDLDIPLKFSRQIEGGNLTCPDHKTGKVTFADYLAERYPG